MSALFAALLMLSGFAAGTAAGEPEPNTLPSEEKIEGIIGNMSLHEKICQLFLIRPEQFSGTKRVTAADRALSRAFLRFPVGGIILFAENITKKNIVQLNAGMQAYAREANGIGLLIGIDEEGGSVSTLANKLKLSDKQPIPSEIGATGDPARAYEAGNVIGRYLSQYGFNVDFAPVADVRMEVRNPEISRRAFSDDPDLTAQMTAQFVLGLHEHRIISVLKHFPGHGAVSGNTHTGVGTSKRQLEDWRETEWKPFMSGIDAGAEMVMLSHQLAVKVDPDRPASLSPEIIALLRNELHFEGVIITDALRMNAIHGQYGSGEACVLALEAGADMLLLPYNFTNAYNGITKALQEGRLTEERIDESVRRILLLKASHGLI